MRNERFLELRAQLTTTALRSRRHATARAHQLVRPTAVAVAVVLAFGVSAIASHGASGPSDVAQLAVEEAPEAVATSGPPTSTATTGTSAADAGAPGPVPVAPQPQLAPLLTARTAPAEQAGPPPVAPRRGALPVGKGMWLWQPTQIEGGDIGQMVARAKAVGLTHMYVRTGSSVDGFYAAPFLDALLPAAHGAGLRVYGWDFPYLFDVQADIDRTVAAIAYTTPDGHRLDGFSPDIETPYEGVNLTAETASAFGNGLRAAVGPSYPLIATVPRPSPVMAEIYPYDAVIPPFDAVAPMVYWLNRQPDTDVAGAIADLARFGKPLLPIGQAYDGFDVGGRPGTPPPAEINRFLATAEQHGAVGVSFWSWQHASQEIWDSIAQAPQFTLPSGPIVELTMSQVRTVQALLSSLGFPASATGGWDLTTASALMGFQQAAGLVPTGELDAVTRHRLLGPLAPPIGSG